MKITIQKSVIENMLIHAQPFLEKKDTSQITSHVLISVTDSIVTIKATDFEIGLEINTKNVKITDEGTVTANGKNCLISLKF